MLYGAEVHAHIAVQQNHCNKNNYVNALQALELLQ